MSSFSCTPGLYVASNVMKLYHALHRSCTGSSSFISILSSALRICTHTHLHLQIGMLLRGIARARPSPIYLLRARSHYSPSIEQHQQLADYPNASTSVLGDVGSSHSQNQSNQWPRTSRPEAATLSFLAQVSLLGTRSVSEGC